MKKKYRIQDFELIRKSSFGLKNPKNIIKNINTSMNDEDVKVN
jgi:hypothetical protein